jgi:hypothetical protein
VQKVLLSVERDHVAGALSGAEGAEARPAQT